jgi:hypothetical protein
MGRGGDHVVQRERDGLRFLVPTQMGNTPPDSGSRRTTSGVPVRPSRPTVDSSTETVALYARTLP